MGKKQRLKKERQKEHQSKPAVNKKPSSLTGWVIGFIVVLALAATAMIAVINMNKDKLVKFSLVSIAQDISAQLNRQQGKFTINESRALSAILRDIEAMSADSDMDAQIAGHFNFMLNVIKEIVKQGNIKPGEIDKLRNLLTQGRHQLDVKKAGSKKKQP